MRRRFFNENLGSACSWFAWIYLLTTSGNAFLIAPSDRPRSFPVNHADQRRMKEGGPSLLLQSRAARAQGRTGSTNEKSGHRSPASSLSAVSTATKVLVLEEVGGGSYGTVHMLELNGENGEDGGGEGVLSIGKRAWTENELKELLRPEQLQDKRYIKERSQRCRSYYETENHCLMKLNKQAQLAKTADKLYVPKLQGSYLDDEGNEWMVFDLICRRSSSGEGDNRKASYDDDDSKPAMSLQDAMEFDRKENRRNPNARIHHLSFLARALGIEDEEQCDIDDENITSAASMVAKTVVDVVFTRLLEILSFIHENSIVHRDVKPANILVSKTKQLHLIDFGSAADFDTAGGPFKKNIGLSERVAISPIYAAPEIFVNANIRKSALNFDCFSVALIICQLLFQYLDERTDAGFHQQLQAAGWNLNTWLATEIGGKVTPGGLDVALQVLAQRPGLWTLLQDLLRPDPWERVEASKALKRLERIVANKKERDLQDNFGALVSSIIAESDGPFLANVLESLEYCKIPEELEPTYMTPLVRPLQFVATFNRRQPLGLVLSEPDLVNPQKEFADEESRQLWQRATANAVSGEVYVAGIVPGSQADELGIFEIGDRIQGVGELPLAEQGFERVVQMIVEANSVVSPDPKYITLHFDRKRRDQNNSKLPNQRQTNRASPIGRDLGDGEYALLGTSEPSKHTLVDRPVQVVDQAAWSSRGRRQSQEDRYILHEMVMGGSSILLAGVLDGHLGTAAAETVQEKLPELLTEELLQASFANLEDQQLKSERREQDIGHRLKSAWEQVCGLYQNRCSDANGSGEDGELCIADYDAREGILEANTGSSDVVAGTTANLVALDKSTGRLALLNCGDSRCVVLDKEGTVFQSIDHKPERDLERFERMLEQGNTLYAMPQCRFSCWYVPVGDYEYRVARSLEGPFATARGIVSEPDVHVLSAESGMTVVIATDGLWDVMDTAEVSRIVRTLRFGGSSSSNRKTAADIAKILCSMALERGSFDNVSAVILFLD